MSAKTYDPKTITPGIYGDRRKVEAEIVATLEATFMNRPMKLMDSQSRAVKKYEVHELMITDQQAAPSVEINRMSAIAFFEISIGGIIVSGDIVLINGVKIGSLAGYDMNHMPNHMNIVVNADSLKNPQLNVGDKIIFKRP